MKSIHKTLLASLLFNAAALLTSQVVMAKDITVDAAPPADRHEAVPRPRAGFAWAPGHWEWTGHFYSWSSGTWIVEHRGQQWAAAGWEQVGSQWHYLPGHWDTTQQPNSTLQAQDRR
jgi:hypothetical protein